MKNLLCTIYEEVVLNAERDDDPSITPETEAAYKAAYGAFITPLVENPATKEEGLEKEDILISAVSAQSEASFRAGFYTAVELLIHRTAAISKGQA